MNNIRPFNKGGNMGSCKECGEDLGLTEYGLSKCENKVCDLYFKKKQIDPITHLENQILLDKQMNGEEV
jgi:hypothetical protein